MGPAHPKDKCGATLSHCSAQTLQRALCVSLRENLVSGAASTAAQALTHHPSPRVPAPPLHTDQAHQPPFCHLRIIYHASQPPDPLSAQPRAQQKHTVNESARWTDIA